MRSRGRAEKRRNGQNHHTTKATKDKNQSEQNPQNRKHFNTPIVKVYDIISVHVITWYRCGQWTFLLCDPEGGQRKAKMDKSTIGQQPQRIRIKADKKPKRENILILQQSRCTIPFLFMWSHDTGVDNQYSRHVITWADRKNLKWKKHHRTKSPKDKNQRGQNPQKRKYFNTSTIKCMITFLFMWSHDTGVDNQFSRHVITWADRKKPKWTKNTIGQKPQAIKIKDYKTPKRENILILQQSTCTIPFLFMWSLDTGVDNQQSRHAIERADREKSKCTKAPLDKRSKDKNQSRQNPPKKKIF